jgi:hypothetical protein
MRHELDDASGAVRAHFASSANDEPRSRPRLRLSPDPAEAAALVSVAYVRRGPDRQRHAAPETSSICRIGASFDELVRDGRRTAPGVCPDIDPTSALSAADTRALADRAPAVLRVPSGRDIALEYREEGSVAAAVNCRSCSVSLRRRASAPPCARHVRAPRAKRPPRPGDDGSQELSGRAGIRKCATSCARATRNIRGRKILGRRLPHIARYAVAELHRR